MGLYTIRFSAFGYGLRLTHNWKRMFPWSFTPFCGWIPCWGLSGLTRSLEFGCDLHTFGGAGRLDGLMSLARLLVAASGADSCWGFEMGFYGPISKDCNLYAFEVQWAFIPSDF